MRAEDLRGALLGAFEKVHDVTIKIVKLQTSANFMQKQLQIANRAKAELQEEVTELKKAGGKHGSKPSKTSTTAGARAEEKLGLVMVGDDSADKAVQVQLQLPPDVEHMRVPRETKDSEAQTTDELWAALADSARKVTSALRSKTLDHQKAKDVGRLTTLEVNTKDLGEMRRNAYQEHDTLSKGSRELAKEMTKAVGSFRSPTGRDRTVVPLAGGQGSNDGKAPLLSQRNQVAQ